MANNQVEILTGLTEKLIIAVRDLDKGCKAQAAAIEELRARLDTAEALIMAMAEGQS